MNQIEKLIAAHSQSTPGKWIDTNESGITQVKSDHGRFIALEMYDENNEPEIDEVEANAEFIALAHNMMPELISAAITLNQFADFLLSTIHVEHYQKELAGVKALFAKQEG
jgi:hypothetical protein